MGETDEKENAPAGTPTAEIEEPKETEKLLSPSEAKIQNGENEKNDPAGDDVAAEPKPAEDEKKVNGEEIIDIPEAAEKKPKEDGREVKPKKIPIGGIKMPGFFMRNKPKADNDGAEGELLENAGNEAKQEEQPKEEVEPSARPNLLTTLKSWNPFAKKAPKDGEEAEAKTGEFLNHSFSRANA